MLATNVAETSLTVPGVRYVVDPGTARISRYSHRLKVQRLPIEAISRASANQRAGRCGRTSDGICVRLYSEEDFATRPAFTEPEILRTNLASVILAMTAIGLGDVAAFPFLEPPDRRQVKDGVALLEELGALDPDQPDPSKRLTPVGRTLAALPVDPRLGRMVIEADRNGCVADVLVIAAALSIQDPRERPADNQQAADQMHRRFADDRSDFLAYRNLWAYLQEQQGARSGNAFRRMCRAEHLHYLRVREWQDLVGQLRQVARSLGIATQDRLGQPGDDPKPVHLSLLAGLLSHVGYRDPEKREYVGARGARFAPRPGSALFRRPPRWVMAGELVETSRLWGRDLGRIEPEWVEPLAEHLLKRSYSEPHWSSKHGAVMAYEKVLLYGVPIVAARRTSYGRIDPELSRELFIRHALVGGEWRTHHRFFHHNRALLEDVAELEHRARRRDILVDVVELFDFYDQRVPADVVSARHFDAWWKQARRATPDLLTFDPAMLVRDEAARVDKEGYPDTWRQGDLELGLTYQFDPGSAADGVTVHVPLAVLNRLGADGFDWQVPGLRLDLVAALIRSLPKDLRRALVPAPDTARAVLNRIDGRAGDAPLTQAMSNDLRETTGVVVPAGAWDLARVPDHLRMTYRVEDGAAAVLAEGKDLDELRTRLAPEVRTEVGRAAVDVERSGLRSWSFGVLPEMFAQERNGLSVQGFPALIDDGQSVSIRVLGSSEEQARQTWRGVRRLLVLTTPSPLRHVVSRLDTSSKLALGHNPYGSVPALLADCVDCAVDALMRSHGGVVGDQESFDRLREEVRESLTESTYDVVLAVARILAMAHDASVRLSGSTSPAVLQSTLDITAQLNRLVGAGFVTETGRDRLPHLERYLRAIAVRLDALPHGAARDRARLAEITAVEADVQRWLAQHSASKHDDADGAEVRWMIEELRVSLFAQQLGTPRPISAQRIRRALAALRE